jgi:hypothetical protein
MAGLEKLFDLNIGDDFSLCWTIEQPHISDARWPFVRADGHTAIQPSEAV